MSHASLKNEFATLAEFLKVSKNKNIERKREGELASKGRKISQERGMAWFPRSLMAEKMMMPVTGGFGYYDEIIFSIVPI